MKFPFQMVPFSWDMLIFVLWGGELCFGGVIVYPSDKNMEAFPLWQNIALVLQMAGEKVFWHPVIPPHVSVFGSLGLCRPQGMKIRKLNFPSWKKESYQDGIGIGDLATSNKNPCCFSADTPG